MNVALTFAPGATGPDIVVDAPLPPETAAVQPAGSERANLTLPAGAPVVFVNVTVAFCADPGVNVVTRDTVNRAASYFAATMLACTASVVASGGYPMVIAPS